jgi:hypothetical protein
MIFMDPFNQARMERHKLEQKSGTVHGEIQRKIFQVCGVFKLEDASSCILVVIPSPPEGRRSRAPVPEHVSTSAVELFRSGKVVGQMARRLFWK